MVRAPCCDQKMGLKKGPWTHEEDRILVNYINLHGHPNWRALPKLAGLLRCGKSCRLRWTNYLKPDIKRGNFSREEEEAIIQLHAAMGNRWSAIAAKLPGRTDNEIKNVWHTHLKKRVNPNPNKKTSELQQKVEESKEDESVDQSPTFETNLSSTQTSYNEIDSPQPSSTSISSSITTTSTNDNDNLWMEDMVFDNFPEIDEEFWSEVFSGENSGELPTVVVHENISQLPSGCGYESNLHDDMDYWFNVFTRGEELPHV